MTRTTRKGGVPVGDRRARDEASTARTAPAGATVAASSATPTRGVLRWAAPASLVLALVGLVASAYLTYEHLTSGSTLACPEGQVVNCQKVTESSYASVLGIPVAILGLLYFVALVALCLPSVWRRRPRLDDLRLALVGVGTVMVMWLLWAELVQVRAVCLWCTVVHVATVALFLVLVFARALRR